MDKLRTWMGWPGASRTSSAVEAKARPRQAARSQPAAAMAVKAGGTLPPTSQPGKAGGKPAPSDLHVGLLAGLAASNAIRPGLAPDGKRAEGLPLFGPVRDALAGYLEDDPLLAAYRGDDPVLAMLAAPAREPQSPVLPRHTRVLAKATGLLVELDRAFRGHPAWVRDRKGRRFEGAVMAFSELPRGRYSLDLYFAQVPDLPPPSAREERHVPSFGGLLCRIPFARTDTPGFACEGIEVVVPATSKGYPPPTFSGPRLSFCSGHQITTRDIGRCGFSYDWGGRLDPQGFRVVAGKDGQGVGLDDGSCIRKPQDERYRLLSPPDHGRARWLAADRFERLVVHGQQVRCWDPPGTGAVSDGGAMVVFCERWENEVLAFQRLEGTEAEPQTIAQHHFGPAGPVGTELEGLLGVAGFLYTLPLPPGDPQADPERKNSKPPAQLSPQDPP